MKITSECESPESIYEENKGHKRRIKRRGQLEHTKCTKKEKSVAEGGGCKRESRLYKDVEVVGEEKDKEEERRRRGVGRLVKCSLARHVILQISFIGRVFMCVQLVYASRCERLLPEITGRASALCHTRRQSEATVRRADSPDAPH